MRIFVILRQRGGFIEHMGRVSRGMVGAFATFRLARMGFWVILRPVP
jgi:hypothetical protein